MLVFSLALFGMALSAAQWKHFDDPTAGAGTADASTMAAGRILQAHNAVRSRVGVPPLTWSPKLAAYAQRWAAQLAQARQLYHHPNPIYGENLYLIDGGSARPSAVAAAWAGERRNFDTATNSCHGRCGHYTQMVWRNTTALGCGHAESGTTQVWVCEYDPPGNIMGERPY